MKGSRTPVSWDQQELEILGSIQRRVLWLATYSIHYANEIRPNPDGTKVGGHQASSSSVVSILTALYFKHLRPGDRIAIKPHASPVFHAIQALRGKLPFAALKTLRAFGGLQSYPHRIKDPDQVDFSTGSVGLGAVAPNFAALTEQYVLDHFGDGPPGRFIALVGDGELDEGNIWEALGEDYIGKLGNILWIVDLNRQSLDRVVPEGKAQRIRSLFAAQGWSVIDLKYGSKLEATFRLPHGLALRKRIDDMSNTEYQTLLQLDGERIRQELIEGDPTLSSELAALLQGRSGEEVRELIFDLGGHDLRRILESFAEADRVTDRPVMILAYTIKGWGLPFAGDPLNHSLLLTPAQMERLQAELGVAKGEELAGFPPDSPEGRYIAQQLEELERKERKRAARPPQLSIPESLGVRFSTVTSTQEAFGNILVAIGRQPELARHVVTVSPDVAISTNLGGWINLVGVYAHSEAIDYFRRHKLARILEWRQGPTGSHLELGISENNFFLLLAMLGLSYEFTGHLLLPIGTLYDPFVCRGLDSLIYAAYSQSKFIFVGTPSGVSLSREGGSHQSLITPAVGLELPQLSYYEPTYGQELEWILLSSLRNLLDRKKGQIVYLRLSTKPIDQSPFQAILPQEEDQLRQLRDQINLGGYRLRDYSARPAYRPGENVVHIFAAGVMVPEALQASDRLRGEGIYANVFVVTSPDMLYRGYRHARRMELSAPGQRVKSHLGRLLPPVERFAPIVTVMDGHSHTLSFIGGAFGSRMICLGTDEFGQVGSRSELYRAQGIDVDSIASAARLALTRLGGSGLHT
jgi:pyruvate dehydrogenase E1 component